MVRAVLVVPLVAFLLTALSLTAPSDGAAGAAGTATGQSSVRSAHLPRAVHVDCSASAGGTGTAKAPLDSLAAANALNLLPGQKLLFARGTTCTGGLVVQSSGTPAQPITVGAYGKGAPPQIIGTGTDAVLLQNASDVVVKQLDVSNPGTTTAKRRGVHVVADGVTVTGVTLEKLSVHDVAGDLSKDSGGSGGIQFDALGTAPAGRFDGVLIEKNHVTDVSRSGIFVSGTQTSGRPAASDPWPEGSTGVVVEDNDVEHLAGDGIVSEGTDGALLEGNTVVDGNQAGTPFTQSDAICDAGIWAWDANSTVIQDNQVSHMEFNGCDGIAYDVDYNQDGTVIQDNYSYDNAGGFLLLCSDTEVRTAEVRYNLSVDDASTFNEAPCDISGGGVGTLDGISVTDNTFVAPQAQVTLELVPLSSLFDPGDFVFQDNLVDATTPQTTSLPCGDDCSNNLYFQLPASGTDAVVGNPLFVHPAKVAANGKGFRLKAASPAIGAGIAIPGGAPVDFFGTPVPTGVPPTIGFYQAP